MITNILGEYDEAMHYLDQIGVIRGNGEDLTLKERIIRMVAASSLAPFIEYCAMKAKEIARLC